MKNKFMSLLVAVAMAGSLGAMSLSDTYAASISSTSVTILRGKTKSLKMKGTKKKARWSSSNKKVATISSKGKIKAKKKGSCTITAKVGKKKYRCKVKVVTRIVVTRITTTTTTTASSSTTTGTIPTSTDTTDTSSTDNSTTDTTTTTPTTPSSPVNEHPYYVLGYENLKVYQYNDPGTGEIVYGTTHYYNINLTNGYTQKCVDQNLVEYSTNDSSIAEVVLMNGTKGWIKPNKPGTLIIYAKYDGYTYQLSIPVVATTDINEY